MKIEEDIATTRIIFTDDDSASVRQSVPASLHKGIGVMKQGAKYAPSFKRGVWDGYIDFYDKKTQTFPTGLLPQVVEVLHKLQQAISFQFTIEDIRPELYVTKVPPVVLHDDKADIKLYEGKFAYQQEAINQIFQEGSGIINASTNAGKCITADNRVLTDRGYRYMRDILMEANISHKDINPRVIDYKIPLVNRFGNVESASHITVNGIKPTINIKLATGLSETMTYNHPLLVVSEDTGDFSWVAARDIKQGDLVVDRLNTGRYGNNSVVDPEEAYILGLLVADGYFGKDYGIKFTNDSKVLHTLVAKYWSSSWDMKTNFRLNARSNTGSGDTEMFSKKITAQFHNKFGIPYGTAGSKEVPKCILESSKMVQLAFLSGYMECESSLSVSRICLEVTSKSPKLLRQIHLMLVNMGVRAELKQKKVKRYPNNYYGRLTFSSANTSKLVKMLTFKTVQRINSVAKCQKEYSSHTKRPYNSFIPGGQKLFNEYKDTYKGDKKGLASLVDCSHHIGKTRGLDILSKYPNGSQELKNKLLLLCDAETHFDKVISIQDTGLQPTFDFYMPETHSFIAEGIVNHNTEIAAGAIKTILPELKRDERVLFLTNSSVIFNQTIKRLETRLQIPIGAYGGGKHEVKQVTVCTVQTISKGLDIDPEAKVKLTAKENMTKRIAKRVAPQFMRGANLLMAYKSYLKFFRPETKVDQQMQAILEDIRDECGTDADLGERMRQYVMDYEKIIKTKNKDAYKKHQEAVDLLESAQMLIEDECHHAKSDTWYRIGIGCKNALYRIGLSGTIDKEDEMAWQRLQALFHKIIIKVSNDDLIGKGISAKPKVSIVPITVPHKIKTLKPYAEAYTQGIVTNKFRNNLIASIGASWAVHGKATLIIVNQIAQGEMIGDYLKHPLKGKPTDYEFLTGPESQDEKDRILNRIKSGDCLVMIATSLVDEGLDVSNFRALVMAAGGKSMRQVLQRVGRVLRKKKVGPNKCDVIDFYDEQNNFLLEHSKERIKLYKNEGFELNWVGGEK